jgi:hypothetical protein
MRAFSPRRAPEAIQRRAAFLGRRFRGRSKGSATGVAFNPVNGQQAGDLGGSVRALGNMFGVFAQVSWKIRQLTLNYGIRFEDFGNPSPKDNAPLAQYNARFLQIGARFE